uniref:Secreted protein n=1 Tax=Elaeophora elaphi TaxID=1147741 RepID=A0A0R3RL53_9BILA
MICLKVDLMCFNYKTSFRYFITSTSATAILAQLSTSTTISIGSIQLLSCKYAVRFRVMHRRCAISE